MTIIADNDLQLREDWETHMGPDISGIPNPPLPTLTRTRHLAVAAREFYVRGPGGADVLYALHRSLPVNHGNFHLSFRLMTDADTLSAGRCLEFDSIVTLDRLKYNMSSQFNFNTGQFQISESTGQQWVNTGLVISRFIPYQWYPMTYDYWFDSSAKRYSILAMTLDGTRYPIPSNLQRLAPIETDWADVISLQVQLDLDTQGGQFGIVMAGVKYTWDLP